MKKDKRAVGLSVALVIASSVAGCAPRQAATAAARAAPAPPPARALVRDPALTTGVLSNGLTYFLRRHAQPEQRAFLMLVVRAGSVLEDDDQRGLAHFVEHMAFSGTRRFPKNELVAFFERSGMQFGADANAFTGLDRTIYMLQVPTDSPTLLSSAFDVLEDWASALSFAPAEVTQERAVIEAEWLRGRNAGQRLQELAQAFLLPGSRYVERRPIGQKDIILHAPLERITSFYSDWYRPDNMAVIAVGDLDVAATLQAITTRFGALKNSGPGRQRPSTQQPQLAETRALVISDAEASSLGVSVTVKTTARPYLTEADERRRLLEGLVVGMINRRLSVLSKQPDAPFLSAGGDVVRLTPVTDAYQAHAMARTGHAEAALRALWGELERVRQHGFLPGELDRSKTDVTRQRERVVAALSTAPSRELALRAAEAFVQEEALLGPAGELSMAQSLLPGITLADVNRAALEWLSIPDRSLLLVGPARDSLPKVAELLAALHAAEKLVLTPYVDRVSEGALLAAEPSAGSIVHEAVVPEIGVIVWTLSNGAKVVLKPTDFKQDELLEQSISSGGHSLASDADFAAAALATSIVISSGVGSHDVDALGKLLSGKVVSAFPWISEHEEGVRGSASPKDTEALLQLMHLYLTAPRRDEGAFATLRSQQRQAAENRDLNPLAYFGDAMSKQLYDGHLRRQALSVEMIDALDLDAALKFYRERLGDVGDFTFVFVGKLDPLSLRPLVERYLASVPGSARADRWRDVRAYLPKGVEEVRVRRGQAPKSQVGLLFHGNAEWSADAEDDLRMLRGYLETRLREVIREEKGGSYGISVQGGLSRRPRSEYMLSIGFDCPPTRVDELKKAVFDVIAELKTKGTSADTVQKLKELRRRRFQTAFRENGFWLEALVDHYKFGTDPRAILDLEKSTERVSSAALQRIAKTYLDEQQYVDAVLLPE